MNYYLIGSGNMAWFLASRMQAAGHTCSGIAGRNPEAVSALAKEYQLPVVQRIYDGADCCLLCVSDDVIGPVAGQLSLRSTTLIHLSGSVPMKVLSDGAERTGVVWPIYSILRNNPPAHRHFPGLYEASCPEALTVVKEVAGAISDISYPADSAQRRWMHLTAVIGNNFTNYLLGICADICKAQDLPFSLLQPILHQTLDRIQTLHPRDVQTGPARRNDELTMQRHLELMEGHADWQKVYEALSAAIGNAYRPLP